MLNPAFTVYVVPTVLAEDARTPSWLTTVAPGRPWTAMVVGGAGRSRLTKSAMATLAVKVCCGPGAGSVVVAIEAAVARLDPVSAAFTPAAGSHAVPLNAERVPTIQ